MMKKDTLLSQQADSWLHKVADHSSPNLGEQPKMQPASAHSSPKLGEVPEGRRSVSKLNFQLSTLLQSRFVRRMRLWVRNVSLPGNKGVPLYDIGKYLLRGIFNGDLWRASKGLAWSFFMALPPLLIFAFTLIAYLPFDGLQDELLFQIRISFPESVYTPIANTVNDVMGHRHSSLLSIGFITSVILAANAINSITVYFGERSGERRTFVRNYPVCLLLVFLLYILLIFVLGLFIGYKTIIHWLFAQGILERGSFAFIVINIGRWIILIATALFTLSILYYIIPMKKQRVGFFSSGAVFATGMFILFSWGFKVYLSYFNRYNILYGSIGTLLLIMLWLQFNCFVILLGYELNTAILNGQLRGHTHRHRLKLFRYTHSSVSRADSSPNLGEQPRIHPASDNASDTANDRVSHSSPKLGEVAQRAGGVCQPPTF